LRIHGFTGRHERSAATPRVGLFGLLGSGNIGNDALMESVLRYLKAQHPDARLDAMCKGPDGVRERYGVAAIPLNWYQNYEERASHLTAVTLKTLGKGVDVFRTASWVRRHDVVIVPGSGVLEASLPLRPWGMPYAMFLLCAWGRLFGTKVALVSVGATVINQRLTRWLFNSAARLAFYRSYRDAESRDVMRRQGLDVTDDNVYPDLAFGIPVPPHDPGDPQTVGVGVMDYHGANDDRRHADEIYTSYIETMKSFVRWLVDDGRRIRLLVGDTNNSDGRVVQEILADLRAHRPDLDPSRIIAAPVSSFAELMQAMAPVSTVVATRFHNVICALRLAKPAISLGYAPKFAALMTDMGLSEFCQSAYSLDAGRLIEQFCELEKRQAQLRQTIKDRNVAYERLLDSQFSELSAMLFPADRLARAAAEQESAKGVQDESAIILPGGCRSIPAAATTDTLWGGQNSYRTKQHTQGRRVMKDPASSKRIVPDDGADNAARYRKRDFWSKENAAYSRPHYRLEKSARVINGLARGRECTLLDVGCGPATLMRLLPPNIEYYGVDIAIPNPASNLLEADLLEAPIRFGDKRFDIIVAQGFFEYVGAFQPQKLAEIAKILNKKGTFIVSYTNFGHRNKEVYWLYNNVQSLDNFRESLTRYFKIQRFFPTSHNWNHTEPNRTLLKNTNMHINVNIPFISPILAVEYFFVCSQHLSQAASTRSQ